VLMGQVGDEGGRSAVADSLVWEKKLGKMGCVWGVFGCVGEEKKIQKNGQGGAAGRTGRMRRRKNLMNVRGGDARFCQGKGRPALVCLDKDQGLKRMGVSAGRSLEGYVWGRWRKIKRWGAGGCLPREGRKKLGF